MSLRNSFLDGGIGPLAGSVLRHCQRDAGVLLSCSLRIRFVFSWYSLRILFVFSSCSFRGTTGPRRYLDRLCAAIPPSIHGLLLDV